MRDLSLYGPEVIGVEEAARQAEMRKTGANIYGSEVVGPGPEPKLAPAKPNAPPPDSLSVKLLEKALAENPASLDELLEGELSRPEGPRLQALYKFREVEMQRPTEDGGARADILDDIDKAITKKQAK